MVFELNHLSNPGRVQQDPALPYRLRTDDYWLMSYKGNTDPYQTWSTDTEQKHIVLGNTE
jgi:hypothetical protein